MTNDLQIVFIALLMGVISAYLALRRGKNPFIWFCVGALLGVLGLLILFFMSQPTPEQRKGEVILPREKPPSFVQKNWYYLDSEHNQYGPISFTQMKGLFHEKRLLPANFVWQEEMTNWKKLEDLPEVLSHLG